MADETIRVILDTQVKNQRKIDDLQKELKDLEKQVNSTGSTFKRIFETTIGNALAIGLTSATALASRSAKALFNTLIVDGIAAAQASEDAINRLNTSLVIMGEFSSETTKDLQDFAAQLQKTTTVGADTTLEMLALSQAFGFSAEQSKIATEAAVNLAAAAGIALEEAVRRVGRTISGSVADVSKFATGINDLTKAELAAGKAADVLLKALGGTAQAQIQTFSGAIIQATNSFEDLTTEIGKVFIQNVAINDLIKESTKVFGDLADIVKENEESLRELATSGVILLANSLVFLFKVATSVIGTLNDLRTAVNFLTSDTNASALATKKMLLLRLEARVQDERTVKVIVKLISAIRSEEAQLVALANSQKNASKTLADLNKQADKFAATLTKLTETGDAKSNSDRTDQLKKLSDANKAAADSTVKLTVAQKVSADRGLALAKSLGVEGVASPAEKAKAEQEEILALREQDLLSQEQFFARQAEIRVASFEVEQTQIELAEKGKLLTREQAAEATKANEARLAGGINKIIKARTDFELKESRKRVAAQAEALNTISTLQSSGNKTLFRIGQSAALAQAVIDGISSIQKTAAAFPFPFNIPFVLAATAAQAVNIAKIASAKPPGLQGGIDTVPAGFSNDTFPALLSSGERVVPSETNKSLTAFLNNNSNTDALLVRLISAVRDGGNVLVQIGDEEVTASVRRGLESGGTIEVEA